MSNSPQEGSATPSSPKAGKKPRSSVERTIVWGGILILLVLLGVQARARLGYSMTLNALQAEIAKDEGPNPQPLLARDIEKHLVGWPNRTEDVGKNSKLVRLTWRGLTATYGIDLPCDSAKEDAAVLQLVTHGAPEPEEPVAEATSEGGPPEGMMPGMGGPGMGGPGMGGPGMGGPGMGGPGAAGPGGGFNPMDQDADGDGKISKDEAQGRLKENFDQNDTNGDGFIDAEEVAALMERIRSRGAEGGPGGRGRPEGESAPEGEAPGATPPESSGTTEKPAEPAQPDAAKPEGDAEAPPAGESTP